MSRILLFFALIIILVPRSVLAAIEITEVAWMGSVSSANHEWIELYNRSTEPVEVTDWTLADGASLLITLSGTIQPNQYVVLERTSDASAPGAAFMVYTGALVNTGATLTLRRSNGEISDQVEGGQDWSLIGGDNATKATPQRAGSLWSTGSPTPGAARSTAAGNVVTVPTVPSTNQNPTSSPVLSTPAARSTRLERGGTGSALPLVQAKTELSLTITAPTVVYERQPIVMTAVPSGIGRTITDSLTLQWNFGDFTTTTGTRVQHRFRHPGTYLVTLRATFGRHDTLARHTVTVLPVALALTRTDEALFVSNKSVYDVDVSGFVLYGGSDRLTFPAYSYVAAQQSLRIPANLPAPVKIVDDRGQVVYEETTAALNDLPSEVVAAVAQNESSVRPVMVRSMGNESEAAASVDRALENAPASRTEIAMATSATTVAALSVHAPPPTPRWPLGLLGVLLVLAVGAVVWPRRQTQSPLPS